MDEALASFVRDKHIDSFQKLYFLLFLYRHHRLDGTSQQIACQSYLADSKLMERIIKELQVAGLIDFADGHCLLCDEPGLISHLEGLARTFANPLTRQLLLDQVKRRGPPRVLALSKY
jgi:hypothetical protein